MANRGVLIVFEGCDRAGKTTQCKILGKIHLKIPAQNTIFH